MSETQEQNKLNNTNLQQDKYSDSIGSKASKAKAMEEYKKSREGLLENVEKKLATITAYVNEGKLTDSSREKTDEIKDLLFRLKRRINFLKGDWTKYTSSYLTRNEYQYKEAMRDRKSEELNMSSFLTSLDGANFLFSKLENLGMNSFREFSESFAVIKNIQGHYDELTNGSLIVPENAKYHIKASDPKLDKLATEEIKKAAEDYKKDRRYYVPEKADPLFTHEPSPDDIAQGFIGDCWFVSTLSAICVNNPHLIRDMLRDNKDGTVTARFYAENGDSYIPYYVTVDKSIPRATVENKDGSSGMAELGNNTCLWVKLLEKAYAASGLHKGKFNTSNKTMDLGNISSGHMSNAMNAIFGGVNVDNKWIHGIKSDDEFFQTIKDAIEEKRVITADTFKYFYKSKKLYEKYRAKVDEFKKINKKSPSDEEMKEMAEEASYGLAVRSVSNFSGFGISYANHAYTVTKAFEKDGEKYIVVRNPHAKKAYNAIGNGEQDNTIGYSTIPLKEYRKLFAETIVSTPIAVAGYKNPAKEIADITITMINTFDKSRSVTSYITFRNSMSDEFKKLYDAMELVNNIANSKAPSKLALVRAFDALAVKAEKYLDHTKVERNNSNDRNLRVTIAKACKSLAEAYKLREGDELAEQVTNISRKILEDRLDYVRSVSKDPSIKKLGNAEEVRGVLNKLQNKDLYTSIIQINDYAKLATEEKVDKPSAAENIKESEDGALHV